MPSSESQAQPFEYRPPFKVIPNFFGEAFSARLLAFAHDNQAKFKDSTIGTSQYSTVDKGARVSSVLTDLAGLKPEIVRKTTESLPGVFTSLRCPPFQPAFFEVELAAHGNGAFFSRHQDTFVRPNAKTDRLITMVYYFHAAPKAFSGGCLRLHPFTPGGLAGKHFDVEPANDTAVFFLSWFPHEVLPITCPTDDFMASRFAVNCWIHAARTV